MQTGFSRAPALLSLRAPYRCQPATHTFLPEDRQKIRKFCGSRGDRELHSDEKILLTKRDVFVKSIPFEAVLTNKRIILLDRKKNLIPPKDILLATIRDIEGGENAIRDQIITLSLITSTGETRQLVLTFSRTAGGGRKRERDEWLKALKEQTSSSIQKAIRKVVPSFEEEMPIRAAEQAPPKIGIANRPAVKKEIEGVHPMKKIVETGSVPPKPVETTSLPTGSFCSRCGNRVPPESAFCNHCGTKVVGPDQEIPATESAVPQVSVEPALSVSDLPKAERKERPVEKEFETIEPLIEGSVPRRSEAPPVEPSRPGEAEAAAEPPASPESSIALAAQSIIDAAKGESGIGIGASPAAPAADVPAEGQPATVPEEKHPSVPVSPGSPPSPPPPGKGRAGRGKMIAIVAAVLVVIVLAAGAFLLWNGLSAGTGTEGGDSGAVTTEQTTAVTTTQAPTSVPTTAVTTQPTQATPEPTAAVAIPQQGVWVRVKYPGTFKGTLGTAASQDEVSDSGDKFYVIATSEGIVQATIQKADGSGDELVVEVYKDGSLVKSGSTTVPKGTVELTADLKPPKTTAIPTTTVTTAEPAETTAESTTVPETTSTSSP